jgi:hypothetical protein
LPRMLMASRIDGDPTELRRRPPSRLGSMRIGVRSSARPVLC